MVPSMLMALSGNIAIGVAKLPPIRPVMTTLPPLPMLPTAKASEPSVPAKSTAPATPPVAFSSALRAFGSAGS